jgi:hypothetical protein
LLGFFRKSQHPQATNVRDFMAALQTRAQKAEGGHYAFAHPDGRRRGYVQFIVESRTRLIIHRIWTHLTGKGDGSEMMRTLCELADQFTVELMLETIPIGRKPYPLDKQGLENWYVKFGFQRKGKWMIRSPAPAKKD